MNIVHPLYRGVHPFRFISFVCTQWLYGEGENDWRRRRRRKKTAGGWAIRARSIQLAEQRTDMKRNGALCDIPAVFAIQRIWLGANKFGAVIYISHNSWVNLSAPGYTV
jgi:hypothetical protein